MVLSMEVKLEEISPVERKLWVAVPSQNVEKQMDLAYRSWGKKAKIKGFRPGKIPRSILHRYYGKEIEEQVSQELFRQSLNEALEEVNVQPVLVKPPSSLPPVVQGDDFSYSVELEVAPDFTPENYLNLPLESSPVVISEELVEHRMEELRQSRATLKPLEEDRPIQDKDFVVIDYQAYSEGEVIEGGGSENAYLEVGSGKLPGDFEKHLVGLTKGESVAFPLDVPADFINPALAGKSVEFRVKVLEIKYLAVPELDDALAQSFGEDFKTLTELREAVRVDLQRRGEREQYEKMRSQLLDLIYQNNPVEAPPTLVRQEQQRLLSSQLNLLQSRGLNIAGLDSEKMMERMREPAEKQTRINLILEKIAAREGITVSEEDVEAGFRRIAQQVGDTPEMVKKVYHERKIVNEFKSQIRAEKTVEYLIDKAIVTDKSETTETVEKES
ncbi:MAG: trigger factor [Deltaproteobacteria bacterium]|nr:trigger factor [Deltaproteobacteria bacterium]